MKATSLQNLKDFLEKKADLYNRPSFIEEDPVSIPHRFKKSTDIEIAGFLASTLAWGQRVTAVRKAMLLMEWMDFSPYDFILHAGSSELSPFRNFVHRTFSGTDCLYFIKELKMICTQYGSLGGFFAQTFRETGTIPATLIRFREVFLSENPPPGTSRHVADISKNASAKRLNMFLRWMVRNDGRGVDFGLWDSIPPSALYIPLDLHSGTTARKLGLLTRKQNDWKSVEELTERLREFDPEDPVRYDFALFGTGISENF